MNNARKYVVMMVLASFWLCQVVLPCSALAQPQFYVAPVSGANGGIDGVSVGLSIPFGHKAERPAPEPILLAANMPKQHQVVESGPYDHARFYTQAMGRPSGFTSKEELVSFVESGSANATPAQYREALAKLGIQLTDDVALVRYLGSLEWVSNTNSFNARMGRLLVDRKTSEKSLDSGFVREVEANEFVLLDSSAKPPRPIIAGDCGNVILGVIGAATPSPAAAVVPPPPAPAPKPEVRSVMITPTEVPQQRQQATGYGMFANGQLQEERKLSPAAYGGSTIVVSQTMNVQREKKSHAGAWIIGVGLVLIAGAVVYLATRKGCDNNTNITINNPPPDDPDPTPTPTPTPTPEPPTPEPPTPEPPHPNPQP